MTFRTSWIRSILNIICSYIEVFSRWLIQVVIRFIGFKYIYPEAPYYTIHVRCYVKPLMKLKRQACDGRTIMNFHRSENNMKMQ